MNNDSISNRLLIEDKGASRINRLAQVASSKSVLQKVLELAWTAGPVTLLASLGGYYMGHGKFLPKDSLIFFVGYTVISGIISLVAHFLSRLTRDQKQELAQTQLTTIIGDLPDQIIALRDLYLGTLDPTTRQYEATRLMLQNIELGPQWLSCAVRNSGGSEQLAHIAETIEIYRRSGLHTQANELLVAHQQSLQTLIDTLHDKAPPLADSLQAYFHGYRPGPKQGLPRISYFIDRIFSAIEDNDDSLMTLHDVEAMLLLLFELLCGRSIPRLTINYVGNSQLANATNRLEKERLKFRTARAQSYNKLLILASYLNTLDNTQTLLIAQGLAGEDLLRYCTEQIEALTAAHMADKNRTHNRRHSKRLKQSLDLYHQAFVANQKTARAYANFLAEIGYWKKKVGNSLEDGIGANTDKNSRGLEIIEDRIYLSDQNKLHVVAELTRAFKRINSSHRKNNHQNEPRSFQQQLHTAKQRAIHIALALNDTLYIQRPDVQRAIYSANAINMGLFEQNLTDKTKIGWGETLSKEIEKDMRKASEAIVRDIYRFYGLKLSLAAQEQLVRHYDADLERLQDIYQQETPAPSGPTQQLPVSPFNIPKAPLRWRLAV